MSKAPERRGDLVVVDQAPLVVRARITATGLFAAAEESPPVAKGRADLERSEILDTGHLFPASGMAGLVTVTAVCAWSPTAVLVVSAAAAVALLPRLAK